MVTTSAARTDRSDQVTCPLAPPPASPGLGLAATFRFGETATTSSANRRQNRGHSCEWLWVADPRHQRSHMQMGHWDPLTSQPHKGQLRPALSTEGHFGVRLELLPGPPRPGETAEVLGWSVCDRYRTAWVSPHVAGRTMGLDPRM